MPIHPDQRKLYPFDWNQLSSAVRFRRAGGRCERCGRPHATHVLQLPDGRWWDEAAGRWRGERRRGRHRTVPSPAALTSLAPPLPAFAAPSTALPYRHVLVRLATAHLDHDPTNNAPRNLAALCGRCHLAHDRPEHRRRRFMTLRQRRALGDLFG